MVEKQQFSAIDFRRAAIQRFESAKILLNLKHTLDAYYLVGYSVECIMKAVVLSKCGKDVYEATYARLTSGSKGHQIEFLKTELEATGVYLPRELMVRLRRAKWSTTFRYQSGRKDLGETRAYFKVVAKTIEWAEGEMP